MRFTTKDEKPVDPPVCLELYVTPSGSGASLYVNGRHFLVIDESGNIAVYAGVGGWVRVGTLDATESKVKALWGGSH